MNYTIDRCDGNTNIVIKDGDTVSILYDIDKRIVDIIDEKDERLDKLVDLLITMCFDHDYEDVTDNEDWYRLKACEYDGWQQVMCRWLYKFGYIDKDENCYLTKVDWNRPGEEDEDTAIN